MPFRTQEFDNKSNMKSYQCVLNEFQLTVCLARLWNRWLTLLAAYEGRIINIHPAYLWIPWVLHGIEDTWNAGKRCWKCDHSLQVNSGVDTGKGHDPCFHQWYHLILSKLIHKQEYKLYQSLERLGVLTKIKEAIDWKRAFSTSR